MEEKRKNPKIFLIILLSVAVLAFGGFIVYDKILGKGSSDSKDHTNKVVKKNKDKTVDKDNEDKPVDLDINSQIVKNLYMLIEDDRGCMPFEIFPSFMADEEKEKEKKISASDIKYELKFKMALAIMLDTDKELLACNKYSAQKYFDNVSPDAYDLYTCGFNSYNLKTNRFEDENGSSYASTTLLKEDTISKRIDQIFGPGTYKRVDKVDLVGSWYKYIPEENGYVSLTVPNGGYCGGHKNELLRATKEANKIIITQKKDFDSSSDSPSSGVYIYTYTFTSLDNINYYLEKIKASKN